MTCLRASNVTDGSYVPPALPEATSVSSKRGGLSGGAIAGVVVGAVVGVGLVAGVGVWWFARGKRRSREMHGMRIGEGKQLGGVGMASRSGDGISEEDPNARINRYAELGGTSIDGRALEGDVGIAGGEDRRDGHTRLPADVEGSQGLPGFYGRG